MPVVSASSSLPSSSSSSSSASQELLCMITETQMSRPMMSLLPLLRLVTFLLVTLMTTDCQTNGDSQTPSGEGCEIPVEWRGRYFQSSLGVLVVARKGITTKGFCIERSTDYFLFRNRANNCHQCLLLLRQHRNIIQYKESYCTSVSSTLKLVCTEIRVETPLYTLVRETSHPVPCPFPETSYSVDFNDLSHGSCGRLASSAHRCSLPSRFRLHFGDCADGAKFQNKDIEMECLATWKDGSETYLYSRLTGNGLLTNDERYRCFKYQIYGSDISMSMTADATCRGLRSSSDGPFLLQLHKDESVVSQLKCRFPDWLKGVTWRTLSGKYRFRVEDDGGAIYRAEDHRPNEQSFTLFRCLESRSRRFELRDESVVIRSASIRNCSYFVQCLTIERISSRVIKFAEGKERNSEVKCPYEENGNYEILIPADDVPVACPNPGVHHTSPSGGCIHRLNIGCQDERRILIDHSCSPGQPGLVFECVASWNEGSKVFVVLRKSNDSLLHCFTFRQEKALTIFSSDLNCHRSWSLPSIQSPLSYSILRQETCKRIVRATGATGATESVTTELMMTTRTTTNIFDYHFHHDESQSSDYDFEFPALSKDQQRRRQQQRQPQQDDIGSIETDGKYDDDDDDDDDDHDDEESENTSFDFSGGELVGSVGGRRDVLANYDEPFYSTQRQSSSSSSYDRTKTSASDSRFNEGSFLGVTNNPPSTVFHFVVISNENRNGRGKDSGVKSKIDLSQDSSNRSSKTIDHSGRTALHLFSLVFLVLLWLNLLDLANTNCRSISEIRVM